MGPSLGVSFIKTLKGNTDLRGFLSVSFVGIYPIEFTVRRHEISSIRVFSSVVLIDPRSHVMLQFLSGCERVSVH